VIPKEVTRAYYNNCDLCLVPLAPLPVFDAALPSKMFEIMACARPVLVQSRGEAAWHIERSGAGWTVPPGDAQALAEAIATVAGLPPDQLAAAGGRGRAYAGEHFNRDALASRYLDLLRRVAAGDRSAP
jgi:glycosyltransferase involved in cell wall biosynthesis